MTMKESEAGKIGLIAFGIGAVAAAVRVGVVAAAEAGEAMIPVLKNLLEQHNDKTRTAVDDAKARKAAVAKEQAKLDKDKKAYEKKLRAQRQKQAEKIYKERIKNGYEPTLARVKDAADKNAGMTAQHAEKAAAAKVQADANVEKAVETHTAKREEEAKKLIAKEAADTKVGAAKE